MKLHTHVIFASICIASMALGTGTSVAADAKEGELSIERVLQNARESGAQLGMSRKALDEVEQLIRNEKTGQPNGQPEGDDPVAVLKTCSSLFYVGEPICLDGSASYSPTQPSLSLYYFDFMNGSYSVGSDKVVEPHYTSPGTYYPALQVMDANGLWSLKEDVKLQVANRPPDALFNVENNLSNTEMRLDLDASPSKAYNGSKIKTYAWYVCQSVKKEAQTCITSYDMRTSIDVPRNSQVRLTGELKVTDTLNETGTTQIRMNISTN